MQVSISHSIISKIVISSFVLSTNVQTQIQSSCEYQEVPNRQKSFFNVGPPKESIFLTTIFQSSLHTLLTREPPIVFELLWKSFWRRAGYEPTEVESCNLWSKCSTSQPPWLDILLFHFIDRILGQCMTEFKNIILCILEAITASILKTWLLFRFQDLLWYKIDHYNVAKLPF